MTLYHQQKQIPQTGLMFFQIKEVKLWKDIYFLKGNDGTVYSYKIREEDHNWHKHFKVGNYMSVFYRKVYKGDKVYWNIYPDIKQFEPINPDDLDDDEEMKQALKDELMQKGIEHKQALKDNL